jgi:hypothetical protein
MRIPACRKKLLSRAGDRLGRLVSSNRALKYRKLTAQSLELRVT